MNTTSLLGSVAVGMIIGGYMGDLAVNVRLKLECKERGYEYSSGMRMCYTKDETGTITLKAWK